MKNRQSNKQSIMRIFVILPGEEGHYLTLEQEPSDLVRTMKQNIQNILDGYESASKQPEFQTEGNVEEKVKVKEKLGIESQVLMIGNQCLEDSKRVEDYITKSETFIELGFSRANGRVNISRDDLYR